ncbi:hypothetical protein [Hymenobacter defluvii]|uniref:Uncharacterized protein n=1 Tax=Hymenobacter defluvii TaxID=2054411 RepID=A0ABS3THU4_9BACT|nr:hypothetical protein [Hymenobacter defluvii]MBO3273227.1 hypothetical protein [Hymenobacter defluvii]
MSLFHRGLLLGVLVFACQPQAHGPSVIGIYWDLVATDPAGPTSLFVNGHARYSFRFTKDSAYHYANATEREVVDIGKLGGDYIYPHRFAQRNDSLFFNGQKYHIAYLSNDSLVLQNSTSRSVYTTAREQQKVVKVIPSSR